MAARRARVSYTEDQLKGMRVVGWIMEDARTSREFSLRQWGEFLASQGKNKYTHTDIARYEKAGLKVDSRASVATTVAPAYLDDMAEYTLYSAAFLEDVLSGKFTGKYKPMNLSKLLENARQSMGDFEFNQRLSYLGINEDVLARAKAGEIVEGDDGKLAALLKMDVAAIWAANISSLDDRVNGES